MTSSPRSLNIHTRPAVADHVNRRPAGLRHGAQVFPDALAVAGVEAAQFPVTVHAINIVAFHVRRADHGVQGIGVTLAAAVPPPKCLDPRLVLAELEHQRAVEEAGHEKAITLDDRRGDVDHHSLARTDAAKRLCRKPDRDQPRCSPVQQTRTRRPACWIIIGAEYEARSSRARHLSAPVFLSRATRQAPRRRRSGRRPDRRRRAGRPRCPTSARGACSPPPAASSRALGRWRHPGNADAPWCPAHRPGRHRWRPMARGPAV